MKPIIVAINSISGGGKTTITRELHKRTPNTKALYFDDRDYDSDSGIVDICDWAEAGADVDLFNLERLAVEIESLIKECPDFIFVDYPFGYSHKMIAPFVNYSIFIDTPLDIAMARRILRDFTAGTSTEILADMKQYLGRGRDTYIYGIDSGRKDADFLVDGSLDLDSIIELISKKIMGVSHTNL